MWLENNWKKSSIIAESSIMLKAILLKFSLEIPSLVYICWCQLIGTNLGPNHKNGHSSAIIASNPKLLGYAVHMGQGFQKCQIRTYPLPIPFLLLATLDKNRHLSIIPQSISCHSLTRCRIPIFFTKLWRHWKKLTICFPFFPLYIHFGAFCLAASFFVLNPL